MFGFFDASVIEQMMKYNNSQPRVPDEDFETYFNRRYLEEIKPYTPSIHPNIKYFMAMNHIRQNVLEKCKTEYITKYNLKSDYFDKPKVDLNKKSQSEIKETQLDSTNIKNPSDTNLKSEQPTLRRSKRLQNKAN